MRAITLFLITLAALSAAALGSEAQKGNQSARVVKYQLKTDELKNAYAVAPPVSRLSPGDILETNTVDAFGNLI